MTTIIYALIILCATLLGAFVGLGGGVIIKPLLDLIGRDSVAVVNFISSVAVFSMSISSTIKHIKAKTKIDFRLIITLSLGAVIGGYLGSTLFDYLLKISDNQMLKGIQGIILGTFLLVSVIYVNIKNAKSFKVKNPIGIALVGLTLGLLSSFLGVGGGPINVAFLVLFFSMTIKESAVYSVGIILFSQLSKLSAMVISSSIPAVSPATLLVAIACAVLGGIIGARLNKKGNEKVIRIVFTIVVAMLSAVNFYNAIANF